MTKAPSVETLTAALAPLAAANGLDLVDIEIGGAAHAPLVRVFLDRDGGIDIDAIAAANGWIRPVLDADEALGERCTLEVSSPGIERPLRTIAHFERYAGSTAKLSLSEPVGGARRITGVIAGVSGSDILMDVDGTTLTIPFSTVSKARLSPQIDFG